MTISLEHLRQKLLIRTSTLNAAFNRHAVSRTANRMTDRFSLQEGLVSALWQYWNSFCREVLIGSAKGAIDKSGVAITSPYSANTEMEIAFIAARLAKKESVSNIKSLKGKHLEPTWGDLSKAALISAGISSTNQAKLLSAFSAALSINDLQLCRNANAHLNLDQVKAVSDAKVRYMDTKFKHPSDMIFWIDPQTKDFLWNTWIEEINISSGHAI